MISTTYTVLGMTTSADARAIKDSLSAVAGIGAVTTEIVPGGDSIVTLKHTDDVAPDRADIEAKLREAGDYALRNRPGL